MYFPKSRLAALSFTLKLHGISSSNNVSSMLNYLYVFNNLAGTHALSSDINNLSRFQVTDLSTQQHH